MKSVTEMFIQENSSVINFRICRRVFSFFRDLFTVIKTVGQPEESGEIANQI